MAITSVPGGTYFGSSAVSSVTIPSLSMPAGKVLILIGITRDATDRSLSSVSHPALSNIVTQGNTRAFNATTSRSSEVWIVTADSDGSSGDLTITWSGSVWSQVVRVLDVTAVGDLLTIGWSTLESNAGSFTVTASDGAAEHGVVFASGRVTQTGATLDVSPWSTEELEQGAGTVYRAVSAIAANTTGAQQTVSVSSGNIMVAVAAEILFAPPPTIDAALAAQAATADGEIITHLVDAALQADPATASADLAALIALQAALAAQAGSASGAIDHVEDIAALPAADPATAAAQLASPLGLQAALAARRAEISAIVAPAASLTWPSSLPPPEARPFAVSARPEVARGRAELGPGSGHRLTAETGERQRVQLILDVSQVATFEAFWQSTGYGALPFLGPRHVDDTQIQLVFASDPVIESLEGGGHWRISFELERQWP